MYRLTANDGEKKIYLHTAKRKGKYSWEIQRVLIVGNTTGRAKKFIIERAAQEFIDNINEASKYFQRPNRTEYEFQNDKRDTFIILPEITKYDWQIEAIHDESKLSHDELCKIGCTFLREQGCSVVVNQPNFLSNGESPDVIGFHGYNQSHVVEAKTSRADFLSDKNKLFRANPELGAGSYRWFICEPGLIIVDELPDSWGLVYAVKGHRKVIKEAKSQENNIMAEIYLLYNIARRGIGGRRMV